MVPRAKELKGVSGLPIKDWETAMDSVRLIYTYKILFPRGNKILTNILTISGLMMNLLLLIVSVLTTSAVAQQQIFEQEAIAFNDGWVAAIEGAPESSCDANGNCGPGEDTIFLTVYEEQGFQGASYTIHYNPTFCPGANDANPNCIEGYLGASTIRSLNYDTNGFTCTVIGFQGETNSAIILDEGVSGFFPGENSYYDWEGSQPLDVVCIGCWEDGAILPSNSACGASVRAVA
jgi:hypothetical protein